MALLETLVLARCRTHRPIRTLRRMRSSKRALALVSLALFAFASACRVVRTIEEGRPVAMNPCNVLSGRAVESAVGGTAIRQLQTNFDAGGKPEFGPCHYQRPGTEFGWNVSVDIDPATRNHTRKGVLGPSGGKPQDGLGREARSGFSRWEDSPIVPEMGGTSELWIVAITEQGAKLTLGLREMNASEQSLLEKARALAGPALARMEERFPGNDRPPRDVPPIPVCDSVDDVSAKQIFEVFAALPVGESVRLSEQESFGGPSEAGSGPSLSRWICWADLEPHTTKEVHPHIAWWISKGTPPSELSGERLRGLGASSAWRLGGSYWGEPAGTLSVITSGGRHLEIEVAFLDKLGEATGLEIAKRTAQKLLERLP